MKLVASQILRRGQDEDESSSNFMGRGRVVLKFLGMRTGLGRVILGRPTEACSRQLNSCVAF